MAVPKNLYFNGTVIIVLKTMSSKMREINKYVCMYIYKESLFPPTNLVVSPAQIHCKNEPHLNKYITF
jgi:hypothetical protein